jgi:hypothetical protein
MIATVPFVFPLASPLDETIASYLDVVKRVFAENCWTIIWVACSVVEYHQGRYACHIAIKNANAHKSTVKTKLVTGLLEHRRNLLPAQIEALGAGSSHQPPIVVSCRNGEGPLAKHLFPSMKVTYVVGDGVDTIRLRSIARAVCQHRRTHQASKGDDKLDFDTLKRSTDAALLSRQPLGLCSSEKELSPAKKHKSAHCTVFPILNSQLCINLREGHTWFGSDADSLFFESHSGLGFDDFGYFEKTKQLDTFARSGLIQDGILLSDGLTTLRAPS